MSLGPGAKVDQYEILAPLGSGGMGEVFRAKDTRLNRNVAIKVLSGVSSSDPDRLRRFEQEAQAAAALNHPNILAVYEFGIHEGVPYLVSELLEGKTLRERLDAGPLPIRRMIEYGAQIARGLAAAHEKGIIHRDLKPDNLFLTKDGQVKILDFGLARMSQEREVKNAEGSTDADRTQPGIVMGTVGYMSPEQVRGQVVDHRSDIFSFASILYEMLTGRRAFHKPTSPETMAAILNEEPTSPAELAPNAPVALQRLVLRGLEKNPEQRFQSASDMAFALEGLADVAELSRTMIAQRPAAHRGWTRRVWFGAALALLTCLGVLAYLWMRPVPVPRVANYVQLTHDGLQKSLIATDGSRIYMILLNSGVQDVAAIPTSGGEQTKIRMPSPNMVPLDLSPDGLSLLVVDGKGIPFIGPLWSLPALGGSPRRLGNAIGDSARWSPDGNMLAYANGGDVFLALADGTDPRKLAKMESLVTDLTWAPDGSHLRFDTSDFSLSAAAGTGVGQHAMWEIAADGSNPHKLLASLHNPSDECCGKWTADGRYFVFQSQGQIWALPERGGLFHPEPQPIQLTASPMSLFSPLTSKDGKKLYVVGRSFRGELMRYDANSGKFAPELGGISGEYVSFSKDGRWAAYVAYPEATLWKCKADGTERQQLTFPPLRAALPRWSPDGASIVFFSFPTGPTKPARLYKISAAGGTPEELLPQDRRNHMDGTWSADGKRLAFGEDTNDATITHGRPMIHILNMRTRELMDVAGSLGLYSPRWSPDGRYLAAMTADSSTVALFDFKSQKWTHLAHGTFGWPEWSRDGRSIYVLDMSGKGAVARIRISDGKVEQLVDLKNFLNTGQAGGALSVGPDDALIMLRDTGTQDVYALDWNAP